MKTNVGDYTDKTMTVFSTWTLKRKKLQIPRWCFNNNKEKKVNKIEYLNDSQMSKI